MDSRKKRIVELASRLGEIPDTAELDSLLALLTKLVDSDEAPAQVTAPADAAAPDAAPALGPQPSYKKYLLNLSDVLRDSLLITDSQGEIVLANPATCRMLGYDNHELIGRPISALFTEPFAIDDSESYDLAELHFVTKDGRHIPVSCSRSQLRDDQGRLAGCICVAQDRSEYRDSGTHAAHVPVFHRSGHRRRLLDDTGCFLLLRQRAGLSFPGLHA
ncbi:MAG: PAS domain-containing protein [Anaerolineae bacterium]